MIRSEKPLRLPQQQNCNTGRGIGIANRFDTPLPWLNGSAPQTRKGIRLQELAAPTGRASEELVEDRWRVSRGAGASVRHAGRPL
jgi:hypothetical protein